MSGAILPQGPGLRGQLPCRWVGYQYRRKPQQAESNRAVTRLYFYDKRVTPSAKQVKCAYEAKMVIFKTRLLRVRSSRTRHAALKT